MERNYATQMDAARRGIVTPELKKVAEKEYMAVEDLMPLVASGKVAIPANKLHTCIDPEGIGSMLRTKINVNLGVSKDCKDYDVEMQKVLSAVNMGAEAIMDLSSHGNTQPFRRKLTSECPPKILLTSSASMPRTVSISSPCTAASPEKPSIRSANTNGK